MAYVATQHERIRIRSLIVSDQNSVIYCLKSKHLLGFICLISPIKNTADAQLSLERAWPGKFVSKLHISWENAKAVNHAMKKKKLFLFKHECKSFLFDSRPAAAARTIQVKY